MMSPVPADISIDIDIAQKAIEQEFKLDIKTISSLGEGWDNLVFLVNDQFVFRFPRRKVAIPLLEREMSLLLKLKDKLPLTIPHPSYVSQGNKHYSFPFYGHKLVTGQTGCGTSLNQKEYETAAKQLGNFLKMLHSLDKKQFITDADALTPVFDRVDVPLLITTFDERHRDISQNYDLSAWQEKIQHIREQAQDYVPDRKNTSLVHGDLYHRHLVFSKRNELTGVIDWGDSCVTDPVVDFGVLFQFFPQASHNAFWQAYGEFNPNKLKYARFFGLYSATALLWYGHGKQDQDLIKTSLKTYEMI